MFQLPRGLQDLRVARARVAPAVRQTGIRRLALRRADYREFGLASDEQATAAFEIIGQDSHRRRNEAYSAEQAPGAGTKINTRSKPGRKAANKSLGEENRKKTSSQSGGKSDAKGQRS